MPYTLHHHLQALAAPDIIAIIGDASVLITAPFVEDSRLIEPGGVFVARAGKTVDGHTFVQKAVANGAAAIIGENPLPAPLSIPYVQVQHAHLATGLLAASYYDFPSSKLVVCGVTGTNGKTTSTHLLHSILKLWTHDKAGFISTIGADFGGVSADTGLHVTTPHAPEIQQYLAQMVASGLTHVVLEMTSHGLEQGRLSGVDVDLALVTNITHEHLDFHGSFAAYRDAKAIMFRMLSQTRRKPDTSKISIINGDDPSFDYLRAIPADTVVGYGVQYQQAQIDYAPAATHIQIGTSIFDTQLVGEFNAYNALGVIAAARALGVDDETIRVGLAAVAGVSGRMERIDEGQDFIAIVDFAHTPDALEKALHAGRGMLQEGQRLISVFGSAGLRDVQKRRMMAEVSAQFADMTVLTAEDPRTESLDSILQMMAEGCISQGGIEGEKFIRVPDRGQAIYEACKLARAGDLVMVCGKGHEQSMCFGTIEYPWDDRDALRAALRHAPLKTLPTA